MSVLYEPFYDFERFLDDAFHNRLGAKLDSTGQVARRTKDESLDVRFRPLKPRMDLHEDSKKNQVTATFELPGVEKDDVDISIDNNRLTISVERNISESHDESGYAVRERRYGNFARTLQLPQGVKDNEIKARMDNGVLTVTFPKASTEALPKKITIN